MLSKITLTPTTNGGFSLNFHGDGDIPSLVAYFGSYVAHRPIPFPLPLNLDSLPPFTRSVLMALQNIPYGQTATYQEIAKQVGSPDAARAVGNACRVNPYPLVIPCHRVISSDGSLGGFAYGTNLKEELLQHEITLLKSCDLMVP